MNKVLNLNNRDRNILVGSPLIVGLTPLSLAKILAVATILNFESRDILFREGDAADYFYTVLTGYVRLYCLNKDGREADIRVCGTGDTFGECLLTSGDNYDYNAQAAENITIARFNMQKMRQLAEQEHDIARAIIHCLSNDLRRTMSCIANDRLQTAPQRVAQYLLDNCPSTEGPASIRLPFQKSLLAGKLGLAPEALSRAFSSLRDAGVIVRGRMVQIEDISALKQI